MLVLMHLARQALRPAGEVERRAGLALWIGRACWPSVIGLAHAGDLLRHGVLVDDAPRGNVVGERLWAIDLALRYAPSVTVDGSELKRAGMTSRHFDIKSVLARVNRREDPWTTIRRHAVSAARLAERFEELR